MATYKVLQDIEAEDKFLGPLTLKQFIFAAIALVSAYLSVIFISKGVWVLVFPMVPLIVVTGFLAFPWGRDQPTEVWLLAKLRFMFKPRKRIWDQTGIQELVKITAPIKMQEYLSDNLSQTEVKSRLRALADTIDSRGWAIKSVGVADAAMLMGQSSDRLVDASTLPRTSVTTLDDDDTADDMFDNPQAAQITNQISQRGQQSKANAVQTMQQAASSPSPAQPPANFWFMNQPSSAAPGSATFGAQITAPATATAEPPTYLRPAPAPLDDSDVQVLNQIHQGQARSHQAFRNHKTISPNGASRPPTASVTAAPDPVTIELARNNDRNVASLARETNRLHSQGLGDDEVIVSLH